MQRTRNLVAHSVGLRKDEQLDLPSRNHFKQASLPKKVASAIERKGLSRVAGNIFSCPSTKDFWAIKGDKLVRLTVAEVDNGESIQAAPVTNPANFLNEILNDISF